MATVKRPSSKKKIVDDNQIIGLYMDQVLENNKAPESVYLFCKENGIEESQFYTFFGSLDAIRQEIWVKFFENAVNTIQNEVAFESYSERNRLLTLYFTLFEIFTLNRSYIVFSLKDNKEGLKNIQALKLFRKEFKDFVGTIIPATTEGKENKVKKIAKPVLSEGSWIQFLFVLKFWLDDTSKGFEKTDIMIEKSVNTAADLMDTKPLESLLDLGKFIWKEKFN